MQLCCSPCFRLVVASLPGPLVLQAHRRRGDWLLRANAGRRIVTGRRSLHKTEILINSKLLTIHCLSILKPNPVQEGCRPIPPGAFGNKRNARTFEEWLGISSDQGTNYRLRG